VTADVDEFKRGTAERDHLLLVYNLVWHYDRVEQRVLLFRPLEMSLGIFVCDDDRALILKRFAAGDVIEMGVAIDKIFHWLVGNFLDLSEIGRHCFWTIAADRVGRDHTLRRDDEHGLVTLVAEQIDIIRAVNFSSRERRRCGLRNGAAGQSEQHQRCRGMKLVRHMLASESFQRGAPASSSPFERDTEQTI